MTNKAWFKERLQDPFLLKARQDDYRSRAAYKLIEIAGKYGIIRPGFTVLDLGAAPGSWSQIALKLAGKKGTVVAIDLLDIANIDHVNIIKGDLRDAQVIAKAESFTPKGFDAIISDAAPDTTGVHFADSSDSTELVHSILDLYIPLLKPGGSFTAKVFEGSEFKKLLDRIRKLFKFAKSFSPKASLSRSREVYVVAQGYEKT